MTRRTLLAIGSLLSTLPLLLPLAQIANIAFGGNGLSGAVGAAWLAGYIVGFAALVTMIVLYAIDAFRDPTLSEGWQAAWLVLFIVAGAIAVPVYWWRRVRRREA